MVNNDKTIKFHGQEVQNVAVRYLQRASGASDTDSDASIIEFDAQKDPEVCQTINVQVVSEFVTITFYRDESSNSLIRRELIPAHRVEHISVQDLLES